MFWSKNKISKKISSEKFQFLRLKKSLYIAWASFHNAMLARSPISWRQHSDMTIAVDRDIKQQKIQTKHLQNIEFQNIEKYMYPFQ